MCTGGGGTITTVQKSDPLPTQVTDVTTSTTSAQQQANTKQRKKRGISSNYLSADRNTTLGELVSNATGRQTLG